MICGNRSLIIPIFIVVVEDKNASGALSLVKNPCSGDIEKGMTSHLCFGSIVIISIRNWAEPFMIG